jgi:hypothetical protein
LAAASLLSFAACANVEGLQTQMSIERLLRGDEEEDEDSREGHCRRCGGGESWPSPRMSRAQTETGAQVSCARLEKSWPCIPSQING